MVSIMVSIKVSVMVSVMVSIMVSIKVSIMVRQNINKMKWMNHISALRDFLYVFTLWVYCVGTCPPL